MKTLAKLLYVEADEEVTDLVDRLRDLPNDEAVTFVVPERARSFQSPMSFRLMKRYADAYGKHINVITGDTRLQALALESGFSAYSSLAAYDSGTEVHQPGVGEPVPAVPETPPDRTAVPAARTAAVVSGAPRKPPPPPASLLRENEPHSRRPLFLVAATVLGLLFLFGILYLPTATVTISVAGTPLAADVQLIGAPGTAPGAPDQFATQVINASESQQGVGTATGQKDIPAVSATGEVTFTATCSLICFDIPLNKGTKVDTSDGKRYQTEKAVDVPPIGSVSTPVAAVSPGAAGNTDPHSITIIEGNQDTRLTVDNGSPITGGADPRTATVIQQADIDTVSTPIIAQLTAKVQDEINGQVKGLHLLAPDHPDVKVTTDHKVGEEVGSVNVTVTVGEHATLFDEQAVKQLLRDDLGHKVPAGQELTRDVRPTYTVASQTPDGSVTLNGHVSGFVVPLFSEPGIRSHLKGHTPGSGRAFLLSQPSIVDVIIRQDPFPLPWLPFFSSRINIRIQEVSGTAAA